MGNRKPGVCGVWEPREVSMEEGRIPKEVMATFTDTGTLERPTSVEQRRQQDCPGVETAEK